MMRANAGTHPVSHPVSHAHLACTSNMYIEQAHLTCAPVQLSSAISNLAGHSALHHSIIDH